MYKNEFRMACRRINLIIGDRNSNRIFLKTEDRFGRLKKKLNGGRNGEYADSNVF